MRSEQVHERRVGERHRGEDLALVEEPPGRREREQHEQVEVAHGQGAAEVRQAEEEDRRQRPPDLAVVDLAPERPLGPARHRPGDLGPGPRLGHPAGRVVDLGQHDLAGILEVRPDLHRPDARLVLERRLVAEASAGYRSSQAAIFGSARARSSARSCVSRGSTRRRHERRLDEPALRVVDRGTSRSVRPPGRPSRARRRCRRLSRSGRSGAPASLLPEGPELVAEEAERRHEHDRGGLRRDLGHSESDEHGQRREVRAPARPARRRGTSRPGARRGRALPGTSRAGSTCSCSSRRRRTSTPPRPGSGARRRGRGARRRPG